MRPINHLYIGGSGVLTPIGLGTKMVAASIEAGVNNFQLHDIFEEEDNDIKMSLVPTIAINQSSVTADGPLTARQDRMISLANGALSELVPLLPKSSVPLFLAGPELYVNEPGLNGNIINNLAASSGAQIDVASSRFVNVGRVGAMDAIELAFKYLSFEENHYAIVGGVDCFYDYRTVQFLYDRYRVSRPGAYDAMIPGEAAAFLLLVSPNAPQEVLDTLTTCIARPVFGFEEGHILGSGEFRGDALAAAFDAALAMRANKAGAIYASDNGEKHYGKELGVAMMRNSEKIEKKCLIHRPAEFVGDVGSALGVISLALLNATQKGPQNSLVYCSSDSGARGVICAVSAA